MVLLGSRAVGAADAWTRGARRRSVYPRPVAAPFPPFEGRLVRLRSHEPADFAPLAALFSDPEVLEGITAPMPESAAEHQRWIERIRGSEHEIRLVIDRLEDRRTMGACGLHDIDPATRRAELGIWLGRPYWDAGYGTDAVRTLCRYGFRFLNLQRIGLDLVATNERARRAYEKVGFTPEGTRRRFEFVGGAHVNSLMMGLLVEEFIDDV
jgi:RimJ/RimL family protein N-acetyltransferase